MFDADRPILKSSQDRLNRALFAKYLARCMLNHTEPESLVVGLYGSWGVGKTSLINLIREELEFAASNMLEEEKPIILNFSAWSYSGQNQLIYSFFRRLSSTLRNVPYLKNADRIIYLLELYVSFFTRQPIPKALRTKHAFKAWLTFKKREDFYAWESGRDLTLVKAELNELLRQQNHKIVIMIDNISRLYDYEIKQIFQIVKSMGDYDNTTYLLAFDKEQVIRELNKIDGAGSAAYIEKIIQLPFDIPPISQQDLEQIFVDRLNEVINTVPADAWNTEYWADIYYSSLKFFFVNCRDITRYVNTLSFGYSQLRDVVNPVDFFALTALEVFAPEVYFAIRENKDLFTDLLDNVYVMDSNQIQKDKIRCDEIVSRSSRVSRDVLIQLLIRLFPSIRKIYTPEIPFYHSEATARKLRRICSSDLFDIYFRLTMKVGQIPESEFETLLSLAADPPLFDQALTRLNQDERILKFLDLLDSKFLQSVPRHHIQAIVTALLDNGDLFPFGSSSSLSLDTPMRIHRIISALLKRLPTSEERFSILQNAIAATTKSLFMPIHELRETSHEHNEESDVYLPLEYRQLTPEQLTSLQGLMITRIKSWAQNGSLESHPQILAILYAWRDWEDNNACKQYVEKMTKTDKGLVAFLMAVLDKAVTQAMTKYEKNPYWEKYLNDIQDFISINRLEEHAKLLFEDAYFEKLREREQLAIMIFLDLVKAPTKKLIPKTTS